MLLTPDLYNTCARYHFIKTKIILLSALKICQRKLFGHNLEILRIFLLLNGNSFMCIEINLFILPYWQTLTHLILFRLVSMLSAKKHLHIIS